MREKPSYQLQSVDAALQLILELQREDSVRLTDVAKRLGLSNSTVHRLLASLVYRGFAAQDRDRSYRRGPVFAGGAPDELRFERLVLIRDALTALVHELDETTHFVVLEGNGVRFVDGVVATRAPRVGRRVGLLLPAHTNSGGRALLALLTGDELRALYPRGIHSDGTQRRGLEFERVDRELAATRRRGFGINMNESAPRVHGIGVAVRRHNGRPLGAIEVGVPSARYSPAARKVLAERTIAVVQDLEIRLRALDDGSVGS